MAYKYSYLFLFFFFLMASCQQEEKDSNSNVPSSTSTPLFIEKDAAKAGLAFSNNLTPTTTKNILEYLYYYNGAGVAIGDINQDGLEDVFLTANESADKLFLNKGELQFEEITEQSGIEPMLNWSTGVTMDDVNGDGLLDIYVCKVAPFSEEGTHNLLYLNKGDGTFVESAKQYGLDFSGYTTQASFFDYDLDGDLDMYLLNQSVHSVRSYGKIANRKQKDELAGDRLFENQLNEVAGKFVDVTEAAGIYSSALGYGLALITTDINKDGLPDIYVGNDFHENDYLYLNKGDGTFTEAIGDLLNHCSKFTMGVDIADMNNDGSMDIFTTDMLPYDETVALQSGGEDTDRVFALRKELGFEDQYARNHFQLQTPQSTFVDIALMTNTYATDWSWSVLLQDFDNNGQSDIFITNGIVKRPNDLDYINFINQIGKKRQDTLTREQLEQFLSQMPAQRLANMLFLQNGDLQFSDITTAQVGSPTFSNGAAYADLDKDGDLDIITNNINQSISLLENTGSINKNFIAFELKGNNAQTLKGTSIEIVSGANRQLRQYTTTRGYQASSTHYIHFGLGDQMTVDSVFIIWPDNTQEVRTNLAANQYHTFQKGGEAIAYQYPKKNIKNAALSALPVKHIENKFEDYNADKLIPELLSREGPAAVYADFNQDGKKDIFIGGARYQRPRLLIQQAKGFKEQSGETDLKKDKKYEDIAAAAIDFDKDGDLDLYVVSGGNDEKELNKNLEDRLYLNDGKGNLKRLPISLPHTNGSTVAVGDFDQDGFDDLFIGARSIPSFYGLAPYSFILKNKGGFGVEIVQKMRFGMVTHSQWADIDGDKDLDLIFCGDWMSIGVLENQEGELVYRSKEWGLGESAGLWNTFFLKDLNEDGQLDIIAGNAGTNFKWKATPEKPVKLYITDIDKNGKPDPLIFHHYFSSYMPFSPLDKLKTQVPSVRKQFVNYKEYGKVRSVKDFSQIKLEDIVEEKWLMELRSMVYLSENGKYIGTPLPQEAQRSTIQGIVINEQDELIFVGNHYDYLTELGQSTANSGGLFTHFDKAGGMFKDYQYLYLPTKINPRSIVSIGEDRYLIVCNNGVQYILNR